MVSLTVQETRATSLPGPRLPSNIPDDDPQSPPYASNHNIIEYHNAMYTGLNDISLVAIGNTCYALGGYKSTHLNQALYAPVDWPANKKINPQW